MFIRFGLSVLTSLAVVGSAQALVERTLDEKQPIEAVLSNESHNRISVEGGAVEKIYGDNALFSIHIDATTGQAFVNVIREIEKPAALTVVTSWGQVQDLLVTSKDGPSEQILLKDPEEAERDLIAKKDLTLGSSIDLLNKIIEGKIPFGYGERILEEEEELSLPEPLLVEGRRAVEGPFETIRIYRIENSGKQSIVLQPDALKKKQDDWVFLDRKELGSDEAAICLIGCTKDGS